LQLSKSAEAIESRRCEANALMHRIRKLEHVLQSPAVQNFLDAPRSCRHEDTVGFGETLENDLDTSAPLDTTRGSTLATPTKPVRLHIEENTNNNHSVISLSPEPSRKEQTTDRLSTSPTFSPTTTIPPTFSPTTTLEEGTFTTGEKNGTYEKVIEKASPMSRSPVSKSPVSQGERDRGWQQKQSDRYLDRYEQQQENRTPQKEEHWFDKRPSSNQNEVARAAPLDAHVSSETQRPLLGGMKGATFDLDEEFNEDDDSGEEMV
jgi:hypothetical protein